MSIVEGIRLERRPGWVMMYIASPLIPCGYIDVEDDLTLAIRTNFYCNGTAVDRIMWNGYTRVGVVIVHCEVKLKIGQYIKSKLRDIFS